MTNFKKILLLAVVVLTIVSSSVMVFAQTTTEDYKASMLEKKIAILKDKVAASTITQEKADQIIAALKENQLTCDGTGSAKIGQKQGAAFGGGMGRGQGRGQGRVNGNGLGMRNGSCLAAQ